MAQFHQIVRISGSRRTPDRMTIHLDDGREVGVACDVLWREGIRGDGALDDATIDRLAAADHAWLAREAALSLLNVRPRARGELEDRLRRKGFGDAAIRHAMDEMDRLQLIDDNAFAEMWVRDRLRLRPKGAAALVAELTRKRIAPDVARGAIARVLRDAHVDETDLCEAAARKWVAGHAHLVTQDCDAARRRLSGYLARRGYRAADCAAAARTALQEARALT